MRKIFSKNSALVFISLCFVSFGIALACADGEEISVSNFTPEVFVKPPYSPFFYAGTFYYGIEYDNIQNTRYNEHNVSAWSKWMNGLLPGKELAFFLQKASPGEIDSVSQYLNGAGSSWPAYIKGFVLENHQGNKKLIEFFSYLKLAKACEAFAVNEIQDEWDYDSTKKSKKFDATNINESLKKGLSHSRDIFLKERYWFQLERSYYFNGSLKEIQDGYNEYEKRMPRNDLYYRTLSYLAGVYYKSKDFGHANYYFSLVYDNCDALKTTAHFSFHPQEEKDWKTTLALCRNAEEQATLWQMLGVFYADEIRSISEIYKLDPKSQKLDLLLSRAVNKYEEKFQPPPEEDNTQINSASYNDSLRAVIFQIARAGNTDKPWIWNLAAGYIQTIDNNYEEADSFFAEAAKTLPPERLAQFQMRLLKLINKVSAVQTIDSNFEINLLPEIRWLQGPRGYDWNGFRHYDALVWIEKQLANHYAMQSEPAKSECWVNHTVFYSNEKNLQAMKEFLGKANKSDFEKLCVEVSDIQMNNIYEYEAIKLAYADSLDVSILKMSLSGDGQNKILPGNPFNARIQDCHDCDFDMKQKQKYSKLGFLKKIRELKLEVKEGKDVYNNSLLLANAFYNMSQYGNARVFYECKILGEGHSQPDYIEEPYRPMLLNMETAVKYYSRALETASNEEQRAKCYYQLAKCQRNQWYNQNVYNRKEDDFNEPMVNINDIKGFTLLKQYSHTQYYKDVIRECGYFRSYIKNNPLPD